MADSRTLTALLILGSASIAAARPSFAHEAAATGERFRFGSETRTLARDSTRHLLISPDCLGSVLARAARGSVRSGCEARNRLAEASLALTWKSLGGGVNPGAMICLRLGGRIVLGVDARGNQNSFCRFADGSLVSSGTLHYYARKNDERR